MSAMAEPVDVERQDTPRGSRLRGIAAFIAGWLVPGLGHALLRRWTRAAVFFVSVMALAAAGVWLRGNIFSTQAADPFEWLGFAADLGTGLLYPVSRSLHIVADVSHAGGDYGTRFFAAAGALNLLCAFDAYSIGAGWKE